MSNTVGYSLGCVTGVKYNITQGEDATGNAVPSTMLGCAPGCWNGDYRDRSYWARPPLSTTGISGTDYYGALAPDIKFQGGGTYRDICPTVCYCEGPVAEGETVTEYLGRYETRWMALLIEGLIYYGRVDGVLIQASLDLFPDPLSDTATHIALSFDANARPVFAYEDDGTICIRRFVAGVPTTYSWEGVEPCLFFNGVIYYEDSLTDVVCYYLTASGGGLYARIQRENFGVANLVLEDPGLDSLMAVDRGRGALASFMVVELSGKRVFASVYPPWPILAEDEAAVSLAPITGLHKRVLVEVGDYSDSAAVTLGPVTGVYRPTILQLPAASDAAAVSVATVSGIHKSVLVQLPAVSDGAAVSLSPITGIYKFTLIQAGSYSDAAAVTVGPVTGVHAHV